MTRGDAVSPVWLPALDYLSRKFGIEGFETFKERLSKLAASPAADAQIKVFSRLAGASADVTAATLDSLTVPMDRIIARALYCDRFPSLSVDLDELDAMSREGDYMLTHAAMALQWLAENSCIDRTTAEAVRARYAPALVALIADDASWTDVEIEALAMLYYLGHGHLVQERWVKEILSAQRPDGGWLFIGPTSIERSMSDDHITILALWVLLERDSGGKRSTPWIPR